MCDEMRWLSMTLLELLRPPVTRIRPPEFWPSLHLCSAPPASSLTVVLAGSLGTSSLAVEELSVLVTPGPPELEITMVLGCLRTEWPEPGACSCLGSCLMWHSSGSSLVCTTLTGVTEGAVVVEGEGPGETGSTLTSLGLTISPAARSVSMSAMKILTVKNIMIQVFLAISCALGVNWRPPCPKHYIRLWNDLIWIIECEAMKIHTHTTSINILATLALYNDTIM